MQPIAVEEIKVKRPSWLERHMIALFLTVSAIGFDLYLLWQLHTAVFFFGCLQVPAAIAVAVICRRRRYRSALAMACLVAIFPLTSGLWEPSMIALRARRAGVSEIVREGRDLARRFREAPREHGQPIVGDDIPPAIAKLGPTYVWPGASEVGVKMYDVGSDTWTGYVITDSDTAEPEGKARVKRRIAPGLWWVDRS